MRRLLSFLLAVLVLAVTVSAQAPCVVDQEELLSQTEAQTLENSFSQYHKEFGFTVAAATAESFGDLTAAQYAKKCYADNGYDSDGILLLVSEAEGQWYIYTSGICAVEVSDSVAALVGSQLASDLAAGNYYNAFKTFAEKCTEPVCQRLNDDAVTADAVRNANSTYMVFGLGGGLLVGITVALLLYLITRRAKDQNRAEAYTDTDET